jgi:hypothetical protein
LARGRKLLTFIFIKKKNEIMENKKFIQIMKKIIREELRSVIKEELTEILQEGLKSTINELSNKQSSIIKPPRPKKIKQDLFKENKFADILNNTDQLKENSPMSTYASLMTEDINMTSADAMNFGMQRKGISNSQPIVTDAETGTAVAVEDPAIATAMTRDYSALMKAIVKKKNR